MEKAIISNIPNQKLGTDIPNKAKVIAAWSVGVFRFIAAITPAGMAIMNETTIAATVNNNVAGKRSKIRFVFGCSK